MADLTKRTTILLSGALLSVVALHFLVNKYAKNKTDHKLMVNMLTGIVVSSLLLVKQQLHLYQ